MRNCQFSGSLMPLVMTNAWTIAVANSHFGLSSANCLAQSLCS